MEEEIKTVVEEEDEEEEGGGEEESTEENDLKRELTVAKEEIQNLTQQINCLLLLAKNAWRGDATATAHLARVIGVDPECEKNTFVETSTLRSLSKKSETIPESEEESSKQTLSVISTASEQRVKQQPHVQAAMRNTFIQPFLKQSHIDPIRGQNSRQIFNSMIRHYQSQVHKAPIVPNRPSSSSVRPRATKHLYRPASADRIVYHLGTPQSRTQPYFVFAGKQFFQQPNNYAPLYQRTLIAPSGSRLSNNSDLSEESDRPVSPKVETVDHRPQTAKRAHLPSTLHFRARSAASEPPGRSSSALSVSSISKVTQLSERERRDAIRLQRQLNLPRQGWINQHT